MAQKTDRRISFSILANDGRTGFDVPAMRRSLFERIRDGDDPFDRLTDDDRKFLLAELNAAEAGEWSTREWHSLWTAALRSVRQRSVGGIGRVIRRALGVSEPSPRPRGRRRIDRSALLEMSRSGASDDEMMKAFGINSYPRLRRMLNEAVRAESGR